MESSRKQQNIADRYGQNKAAMQRRYQDLLTVNIDFDAI